MGMIRIMIDKIKKTINPISFWEKKGVKIGKNCEIQPKVNFGSEPYLISIGNHVRINNDVQFVTHDGGVWVLRELFEECNNADIFGKITIKDNVHIGNYSIIMPGVTIGNNVIIGCGAIVTKNIPDNSVYAGVPAKHIETIKEYYEKSRNKLMPTKSLSEVDKKDYINKHL